MDLVQLRQLPTVYDAFPGFAAGPDAYERLRFWLQSNSKRQARKNIAYHYDLGNDFYRLWLDEIGDLFLGDPSKTGQESLENRATALKYASMVEQMGAREPGRPCAGDRLRLGRVCRICRKKERGLRVTGLTISSGAA